MHSGAGSFSYNIAGTTSGTVSAQAYMDVANTEFGTGTQLGSMTSSALAYADTSADTTVNLTDPFSLSLLLLIYNLFDVSSFDANVVAEPSILALMSLARIFHRNAANPA